MIKGFRKEMFNFIPDGLPDEFLEVAYRYALTSRRKDERYFEFIRENGTSFDAFINDSFWWDQTLEGDMFWSSIYDGLYEPDDCLVDIDELKTFIDFKPYDN